MTRPLWMTFALAALLLAASRPSFAQLPAARVTALFPPGGSQGVTVDVTVTGVDLDGAAELRFAHPGITAKSPAGETSPTEAKFTVTVAGDVAPGVYDARVVGRFGISNPRAFLVDAGGVAADAKPASSPAGATKLAIDQSVFARATANAVDFWSFEAKHGQRLLIRCDTKRIDSKLIPDVAVLDGAGRELARGRRTGLLDFTAPADGAFTLRVSDLLYRGGPEFAYRLCVSAGPHVDAVFPNVARRGGSGTFTLLGRNLPGGEKSPYVAADGRPLDQLRVEIEAPKDPAAGQRLDAAGLIGPSGAAIDGFAYRLKTEHGTSNAVPILLADVDVTVEAESAQPQTVRNDKPADAQRLTLPAEVAGRFHPRNDCDCFVVEAKKGDTWVVEVVADRLGEPMAVSMVIQKVAADGTPSDVFASGDDETSPGTPAFRTATRDPQFRWEVKEDGAYQISLRDRFATADADPSRAYRLSIRKPAPDFRVVAVPMSAAGSDAAVWSPTLRRNGTAAVRVSVVRLDGHAGDVTVTADALPSGVMAKPITIPAADTAGILVLSASADAPSWAGTIRVVASGKVGGDADAKRDALCGTVVWGASANGQNNDPNRNIDPVISRFAGALALGVCGEESEPVTVAPAEDKVYEVVAGQKLSVPLTVKKSVELKQPLKFKPAGGDGLRNAKELTIEPKKDGGTFELDLNQTKLPPGTYTVCLASQAQFKYVRPAGGADAAAKDRDGEKGKEKKKDEAKDVTTTVYSAPITFTVLPAPEKPGTPGKK